MVRQAHHEGRAPGLGWDRRGDPQAAARAADRQPPMLGDERRHGGQVDALKHADHVGGKVGRQGRTAPRVAVRAMGDNSVGHLPHHPAVTFVPSPFDRLRMAPPGLLCSRRSLRSVLGGLDEVRDVASGRCSRSTSSIKSSRLRRSRSLRPMLHRISDPRSSQEVGNYGLRATVGMAGVAGRGCEAEHAVKAGTNTSGVGCL